jgi:hypothetical protein
MSTKARREPIGIGYDFHDPSCVELCNAIEMHTGSRTRRAACDHCFLRKNRRANRFRQDVADAIAR